MRNFLLVVFLSAAPLRAELGVLERSEEIPEAGRVVRYILQSNGRDFGVNPPHGWIHRLDAAGESISFRSDAMNTVFTIRFIAKGAPHSEKEARDAARELFPEGKIASGIPCITRDQQGVAVETVYRAAEETSYRTRLGYVNYGSAGVEFKVTAPDDSFSKAHAIWVGILNSFQREAAVAPGQQKP